MSASSVVELFFSSELLKLLRETEFDDLNSVFRDILVYADELQPIAVQMLQHLVSQHLALELDWKVHC